MQDKIESADSRQFVTFDPSPHNIGEMRLHACGRQMLGEERIVPGLVRNRVMGMKGPMPPGRSHDKGATTASLLYSMHR